MRCARSSSLGRASERHASHKSSASERVLRASRRGDPVEEIMRALSRNCSERSSSVPLSVRRGIAQRLAPELLLLDRARLVRRRGARTSGSGGPARAWPRRAIAAQPLHQMAGSRRTARRSRPAPAARPASSSDSRSHRQRELVQVRVRRRAAPPPSRRRGLRPSSLRGERGDIFVAQRIVAAEVDQRRILRVALQTGAPRVPRWRAARRQSTPGAGCCAAAIPDAGSSRLLPGEVVQNALVDAQRRGGQRCLRAAPRACGSDAAGATA